MVHFKYVRGSPKQYIEGTLNLAYGEDTTLGLYVPLQQMAYIFLDAIAKQAKELWLTSKGPEFNGHKGLQRVFIRLKRLVEYHEYAHHLQHVRHDSDYDEFVADRYATMRYLKEYHRTPSVDFVRKPVKEVLK